MSIVVKQYPGHSIQLLFVIFIPICEILLFFLHFNIQLLQIQNLQIKLYSTDLDRTDGLDYRRIIYVDWWYAIDVHQLARSGNQTMRRLTALGWVGAIIQMEPGTILYAVNNSFLFAKCKP